MSLQWTLVAGFLYAEIGLLILFMLPFLSAKTWNKFFKSRFLQVLYRQATWYFALIFFILALFFLDAIREMRKYSSKEASEHAHLESELQTSMRLFRAQRNFYISGFAMFLCAVIRRMSGLICRQAQLEAEHQAALKQAQSARQAANSFLASGEAAVNSQNASNQEEIDKLKAELVEAEKKITTLEKDKEAVLSQAKSLEKEYDRLSEEHHKLELKVKIQGEPTDKKAD